MILRRLIKYIFPESIPLYHEISLDAKKQENKLIFLAGWGGSKRKNLRKVIQFYNNHGYGVISHTMPLMIPGFVRDYIEDWIAEEIRRQLTSLEKKSNQTYHEQGNTKSNLVCHIYSNNGGWVYASLCKRQLIPKAELTIWDSSPSLWFDAPVISGSIAFSKVIVSTILGKAVYSHPFWTPVSTAMILALFSLSKILLQVQGKFHLVADVILLNKYLRDECPNVPTLLITSRGDKLIPVHHIETFKKYLSDRNITVTMKVFGEEIQHTAAFFKKTEEYIEFIQPFLHNLNK